MNYIQQRVQEAIDRLVDSGAERGLQVTVYRHGEPVIDAVAGVADPATGRPVTPETPFFSYSIGKGVASTVVHVLAECGVLHYDTRIVEPWPEFGAHGKEQATIRHALSQSVGVPGLPPELTVEDLCDWDKMCAIIADAEPWWEPGTRIGYHAVTFGFIIGELVRRATGKPISQVLREEVAHPWGSPTSSSSPYRNPSRAGWPGWKTPRSHQRRPPRCPRCRRTRRCSRLGRRNARRPPMATVPTSSTPTSPRAAP
jgi:CubicO group peptidase (beta-lactamase class C family)